MIVAVQCHGAMSSPDVEERNKTCNTADQFKYVKLSSGFLMPTIGLGTWKSNARDVQIAVYEAIKFGEMKKKSVKQLRRQ